ncbi:temperature dependent protein affecting M2 dsRNA replication-domain-containing protein [Endogone sp. FLAS-F59071]|nr:temperature dependent protein affecting M2 dsRNA replication-domain-containing protein [Endogone sp. FLAS-F59071]|eukprot:RUS17673.1 temperature dependent protein affecting M2 dsRNA replication-domain-containing protein [Endogone sp. FLAS-F59071]
MPVRHFDFFTVERRLVQTASISLLKDTRLGIEGNHWLRKILKQLKEPAVVAMGGLPLGLRAAVERELDLLKSHGIHPFFVFNGLSVLRKDKPFSIEDYRPAKRASGWEPYEEGRISMAMTLWSSSGSPHQADLFPLIMQILSERGIEHMRAPYSAWGQLAYLQAHPRQLVNAIFGGSELLMYDLDKVVVDLDLDKGTYSWINKKGVLTELQVTDDQFLDVCIFAGFENCSTFPPLNDPTSFTFKGTHDLIKQFKTGFNAAQSYAEHPSVAKINYIDTFCRTRCAIKYHLVFTEDGEVRPLNVDTAPTDIHEFIGYRLPDEVYYYLSRGLIGAQVLNTLISGVLIEMPPTGNGESNEYHGFLNQLSEMRTQTLSLLSQPLHPFYQQRKVVSLYWFEPNVEHVMLHHASAVQQTGGHNVGAVSSVLNNVWERTQGWYVGREVIEEESRKQKVSPSNIHYFGWKARPGYLSSTVDIAFCMRAVATDAQGARTISANSANTVLDTKDEIVANTLWKALEVLDFLNSKHTYTAWGAALAKALNHPTTATASSVQLQEPLLLAFELIKFGHLSGRTYSKSYPGSYVVGNDQEKQHVLLIARTLSLMPMQFKGFNWNGTLSRELLVFNDFVKALSRSLRNFIEMFNLSLFLNGRCRKERGDYLDISCSLPYLQDVNTALGLVVKFYLETLITATSPSSVDPDVAHSPPAPTPTQSQITEALAKLDDTFTSCSDVRGDLRRGLDLWDRVVIGVRVLHQSKSVPEDLANQFFEAEQWLNERKF